MGGLIGVGTPVAPRRPTGRLGPSRAVPPPSKAACEETTARLGRGGRRRAHRRLTLTNSPASRAGGVVRFRLGTVDASGALVSVSKSRVGDAGVDLLPAIDFGGSP